MDVIRNSLNSLVYYLSRDMPQFCKGKHFLLKHFVAKRPKGIWVFFRT